MHELSLISNLLRKIESVVEQQGASRARKIELHFGALAHISPDHFREHFVQAARGTRAEGAELEIEVLTDINDPRAQDIRLKGMELEQDIDEEPEA